MCFDKLGVGVSESKIWRRETGDLVNGEHRRLNPDTNNVNHQIAGRFDKGLISSGIFFDGFILLRKVVVAMFQFTKDKSCVLLEKHIWTLVI